MNVYERLPRWIAAHLLSEDASPWIRNDFFRTVVRYGLIGILYRFRSAEARNLTSPAYVRGNAEAVLSVIPGFYQDARYRNQLEEMND